MSDTERMREALQELLASTECVHGYRFCRRCGFEGRLAVLAVPEQAPETPKGPPIGECRNCHGEERLTRCEDCWNILAAPAALPDGKDAEREVVETVWRFIDRMTDVDDKYDPAEAIIAQFVRAVMPHLTTLGEINRAAIQAQTEGKRAPSPASTVPQGGDAAANQG